MPTKKGSNVKNKNVFSPALFRILENPKEDANMFKRAALLLLNNRLPEAQLLAGYLRGYASVLDTLAKDQ